MSRINEYIRFFVIGAATYWIPHLAIQLVNLGQPISLVLYTILLPVIVFIVWKNLYELKSKNRFSFGLSISMILGIWFFGPLAIAIGVLPHGGTYFDTNNILDFFGLWAVFPISTMTMSLYSSSLGGLLVSTLILFVAGIYGFFLSNKARSDLI